MGTGKRKNSFLFFTEDASSDLRSLSLLLLVAFALTVIFLKWFFEDRISGFLPGEASSRTYFALYPMKYVDEEGTVALRSRVGDTVSGVLVRDGAAMDRLIVMDRGRIVEEGTHAQYHRQHGPRCQHGQRTRRLFALPAGQRAERQQQHQRCHQQQEQQAEVGRTHRNLAQVQRIGPALP